MMTANQLAAKMTEIAKKHKTSYIWGGIGQPITAGTIQMFLNQYTENRTYTPKAERLIGQKAYAFDCVGVIKSILWGWNGDSSKTYGGAKYASNGVPDINANTMITKCKNVSTDFSKIQIGELLWCSGHVGIYIGDGLGVECTPRWDGDVQITAVGNIGSKSGYNTRMWTKHGKLPYVTYSKATAPTSASTATIKVDTAASHNKSYARSYTVTAAALNMRAKAGTTINGKQVAVLKVLPKGSRVTCYGYYTMNGSTIWLYVVDSDGTVGFVSKNYLK